MSETTIAELRELLAKASVGPWKFEQRFGPRSDEWRIRTTSEDVSQTHGVADVLVTAPANVYLIVAAVNALPALLDRIEVLEAIEKAAEKVTSPHSGSADIRWDWYDTHMPALRAALDARAEEWRTGK